MKILVRLPNWLGDTIMASGFIHSLEEVYPGAEVSVVIKKGIGGLLPFFPPFKHTLVFDKREFKSLRGAWAFGRLIRKTEKFDLSFCLPDSFSAATMALATGAKKRIGYRKELRNILLTHTYKKPVGLHRAEEYVTLLQKFTKQKLSDPQVQLQNFSKEDYIVVNINSEAASRRLTVAKAIDIIKSLRMAIKEKIVLVGAPKEKPFIDAVYSKLAETKGIQNVSGKTGLPELATLLAKARLLVSTDSGPAHLANALGTHTIVLFGAGDETNTAPYNKLFKTVLRLGKLSCEPCRKNVCVRFGVPQCLEQLDTALIVATAVQQLKKGDEYIV